MKQTITRKKLQIYNSIVKSTVENMEFKKIELKFMSMEVDFLRSARCLRLGKIINNVIREKMNIKNSILDYIRYKQLNSYSHVQRINATSKTLE